MDGLLVVDKPSGWTSHDVVAYVRRLSGERRAGHAGTLDPLATGVLVLGLGQGTRVLAYLTGADKVYRARVRLGVTTDTFDADGQVTAEASFAGIDVQSVEAALDQFRGAFQQRPPRYSALKRDGRPLYSYARAGIEVEVATRTVHVEALTLRGFEPPDLDLEIECASGFYVRSLANDLGRALGCGGHLGALRRTGVGPLAATQAISIEALQRCSADGTLGQTLRPLDEALYQLPAAVLADAAVHDIVQGKTVRLPPDSAGKQGERCRAYATNGELVAVLELDGEGCARPVRVFPDGHRGPRTEQVLGPVLTIA